MADILSYMLASAGGAPSAFGLEDYQWVSLAMLALIAIIVWKKVPVSVAGGLDKKIAEIKEQLDEAKTLRAEAEKLRDEYAAKIASAEADAILAKAEADSDAMVVRRQRMAEDKIAAAEREAIEGVRASAANAAAAASRKIIAERHDSEADRKLADEVIASL